MENKLTTKQALFVGEYLINGFNATQAAISAGYSENTANVIGPENLVKPCIREAIDKEIDAQLDNKRELLFKVIEEYKKLSFSDVKDLLEYDEDGVAIYPSDDVDTSAVSEIEITEKILRTDEKSITADRKIKFKTHSKTKALEGLGRYLGIHISKVSIEGSSKIDKFFEDFGAYREPDGKTEESS